MTKLTAFLSVLALASACSGAPSPDPARATATFAECLERNGVVAEDVNVELNDDGTVRTIALGILSEGDVAYEPTVRLACTEEVEAVLATD
jgi:hypothetical protein